MASFLINDDEEFKLRGLPHSARLVYFYLRQHMDFSTGITGLVRKVSLQSMTEYLYVEPHQGIKEEVYSSKQVRSALNWLEKVGLIERDKSLNQSTRQSVFKLLLATWDESVQNKVGRPRAKEQGRGRAKPEDNNYNGSSTIGNQEVGNSKNEKVGNPPIYPIYNNTTYAREDEYPMSLDWVPSDKNLLSRLLLNAGINKNTEIPFDVIREFRGFWAGKPSVYKNNHGWLQSLVMNFKNKLQRDKANANRYQSSSGSGKESLVERTNRKLDEWANS